MGHCSCCHHECYCCETCEECHQHECECLCEEECSPLDSPFAFVLLAILLFLISLGTQ